MNLGMLSGFGRRNAGQLAGPVSSFLATYPLVTTMTSICSSARATVVLSGATTAGTLKQALKVTGRGALNWAAIYANDATARTLRLVLTADGRRIVNNTSGSISASGTGFVAVGTGDYEGTVENVQYQPIYFQRELKIQFASSLSETDKVSIAYNVEVWVP